MDASIESTSPYNTSITESTVQSKPERPCDTCRKRKSKCVMNNGSPSCVLCTFHNQNCTFEAQPAPRLKRKPSQVDGVRDAKRSVSHQYMKPAVHNAQIYDYADLQGASLLKSTLGLQNHRHATLVGMSCLDDPKILALRPYDQARTESNSEHGSFRKVADATYFQQFMDSETADYSTDVQMLDEIEAIVSPHGGALIKLYFRIVHPSYPILHKKVYLEKYARSHREFVPSLLAAVYILALNWWDYSSELVDATKSDVSELEKIALRAFSISSNRPKLSSIQAGLLLLQRPQQENVWQMTSQLVAMGQDLGLHHDCSRWHIPHWEKGLRKRLAWGLYMQSCWSALAYGRPLHFPPNCQDWAVQSLKSSDFPETGSDDDDQDGSTEVETGRTMFSAMVILTNILAEVLSSVYSTQALSAIAASSDKTKTVLSGVKHLQLKLRSWYNELPDNLRMTSHSKIGKLSSIGWLHTSYFATEITLHRAVLHSLNTATDSYLIQVCRSAAKERLIGAIELHRQLRQEHLQSFWFSSAATNFALTGVFAALCMTTSLDQDEALFYQNQLQAYRWHLRVSSKGVECIRIAVRMLEKCVGSMLKRTERKASDGTLQAFMTVLSPVDYDHGPEDYDVAAFEKYEPHVAGFESDLTMPGTFEFEAG